MAAVLAVLVTLVRIQALPVGTANATILISLVVDRGVSRSCGTESNIANRGEDVVPITLASASSMLDPIKLSGCPVAENECHTSSDLPSHWLQISAIALRHDHLFAALCQSDCECGPLACALLIISSHREGLCRVDRIAGTGSIVGIAVVP